jgi:hypothetical protein
MTNQEWESGMNDLRQAQLATQRLLELNIAAFDRRMEATENRWEKRMDAAEDSWEKRMEATDKKWNERFDRLASMAESHESQILELRAAMVSLVTTVDNFIKARPNGH